MIAAARCCAALSIVTAFAVASPSADAPYAARRHGDVIELRDTRSATSVSIVPSVGNIAFELMVKGHNVLYWPYASVDEFKAKPAMSGIPFLAPWANRLDEQAFYANGRRYAFDMSLGNVRGAIPIHGFVTTTDQWQVVEASADGRAAWVTSRLDFFRQPMWLKQWPFAHTIEMTHRLADGILEVRTTIHNLSAEAMPVSIGFHPYYRLTDSARDEWTLAVGARTHWRLDGAKIPTGDTEPIGHLFRDSASAPLAGLEFDDVFSDLVRDGRGRGTVSVAGRSQRLDLEVGPKYRAVVVWAPKSVGGRTAGFVCIEPMAGVTDAVNLAERGLYKELQTVPAGGTWQESFWIKPTGF